MNSCLYIYIYIYIYSSQEYANMAEQNEQVSLKKNLRIPGLSLFISINFYYLWIIL